MPSWESEKSDSVCKLSVLINAFISAELDSVEVGSSSVTEMGVVCRFKLPWWPQLQKEHCQPHGSRPPQTCYLTAPWRKPPDSP